jgi:tRNA(Ile)-lysidine synthetase-like protein
LLFSAKKYRNPAMGVIPRTFELAVRAAIERDALLTAAGTVVVACSGGPDSLALLFVLAALCSDGPRGYYPAVRLQVAHLDHGLRGAESAADAEFVRATAASLGLACTIGQVSDAERAAWRGSLEASARSARLRFLRAVAAESGAEAIALGHTLDDQAETVLLHAIRGSGLAGLAGMRPKTGDLIRPLLGLRRADTRDYCAARGLSPRQDASNDDLHFTRNRLRHQIMPLLEAMQPQVAPALARAAELIALDADFLDDTASQAFDPAMVNAADNEIALDRRKLRELAPALRLRVLRRAALAAGGSTPDEHLDLDSIARLDRVVMDRSGARRIVQLSNGAAAAITRDLVSLAPNAARSPRS